MKDFTFNVPQDIIFGKGSLKRLPELLEKSGSKKMLLISGPVLKKIGMVEKVEEIVKASGIEVEVFTDVEANPSVATVDKATEAYKKAGATSIVAFGGGSPMDVAKAVGVLAKYGGEIGDYEGAHQRLPRRPGIFPVPHGGPHLVPPARQRRPVRHGRPRPYHDHGHPWSREGCGLHGQNLRACPHGKNRYL